MTITTVGYDLSPKTFLGKLIGGFTALSGIFILTLPIPIVVNSFASYYKNRLWRNEVRSDGFGFVANFFCVQYLRNANL